MDVRTRERAAAERVEAVALGEEPLERSGLGVEDGAGRPVAAAEHPAGLVHPRALVIDPLAAPGDAHARPKVRQPIRSPGGLDGNPARRVEAEEPDSRLLLRADV